MSATGSARGFTLIEALLVLVILSIAATLIVVNLPRDPAARLDEEARRLVALLEHAQDEAIVAGRPLAWRGGAEGYAFSRQERGRGWVVVERDVALAPRAWARGIALAELRLAGAEAGPGEPLVFPPSGLHLPFELVLGAGSARIAVAGDAARGIRVKR